MKSVDVKLSIYIESSKEINNTDSKFKILVLLEFRSIKIFLQNTALQISLKRFLRLKKL